ncbi:MAG TPA: hypothetical protein VN886_00355, partial [Acidimicrobiales bacterium]|nr:hypothetical protein [Acidimicrobiales bacterium]
MNLCLADAVGFDQVDSLRSRRRSGQCLLRLPVRGRDASAARPDSEERLSINWWHATSLRHWSADVVSLPVGSCGKAVPGGYELERTQYQGSHPEAEAPAPPMSDTGKVSSSLNRVTWMAIVMIFVAIGV